MKIISIKPTLLLGTVIFTLIGIGSCSKEGPVGPAGKDGNMNVQSKIYTITPSMWYNGGDYLRLLLPDSNITQKVVDSGEVHVSIKGYYSTSWQQVPATWYSGSYTEFVNVNPYLYGVKVVILTTASSINTPTVNMEAKVVTYSSGE